MPRSRRTLLKTTGLALGSGTLASVAGCLGDPSTGGDSTPDESTNPGESTSPDESSTSDQSEGTAPTEFTQWLPDPTTTPLRDGYEVQYFDVAGIRNHQDSFHERSYARLEKQMSNLIGEYVDIAAVDTVVELDVSRLHLGSFDPDEIGEELTRDSRASTTATRTSQSEPESYKEFDLYGTDDVTAVSEDVLLITYPMQEGDGVEYTKAILDAPDAKTNQYVDGNEYVAAMLGLVDDSHALWCYPEAMDGNMSRGFRKDVITGELKSWRFGAETTHLTFANTYPDSETANSGELANHIESNSQRFGAYDGIDVETEGQLAWTDGTIPTAKFDHLSAGGPGDRVRTTHPSDRNHF